MTDRDARRIVETLQQTRDLMDASLRDAALLEAVQRAAAALTATLKAGGKLLVAGNGGSAADAQHIAGEIVGRFLFDRAPLAAIALTTDTSILTAVANDYGFDHVYERQVRGLGRPGDLFLGISTSGNSASVLRACAAARDMGIATVGLTGAGGGAMAGCCDVVVRVPSERTFLIQQVHITIGHILCLLAEAEIFGAAPAP
ncbi:SIS domain-containing protein [Lichenibacterium ramalinae]|uniref:Phosphoheptose isomerase n=1 Tax=Lichenibacterium ramalinae TaxID=2316527 RepID=A0A4Q2RHS0_9HYPH|nr:SIS domain-containing protein [Lichenibacterium ramalinae]RYB06669.1 SIS domain-containing protein [Lichenibacterium ramalinae]